MADDLASLFQPSDDAPGVLMRQGVVESWDAATGDNTVRVAGGELLNVAVLTSESASLAAGDVVALLSTGDKWLLLGKVTTPGDPGTVPTWDADLSALAPLTDLAQVVDGTTITGATQATTDTGARVVINDPAYPGRIVLYSDVAGEEEPAKIWPNIVGSGGSLVLMSPDLTPSGTAHAAIQVIGNPLGDPDPTVIVLDASRVRFRNVVGSLEVADNVVTNADLTDPSNLFPASLLTDTGAETVTNKNLTASSNTFPGIPYSVVANGTTDANGFLNVTHGAGFTPVGGWWVCTNPASSPAQFWGIDTIGALTCRLRFASVFSTAALASTAVQGRLFLVKP